MTIIANPLKRFRILKTAGLKRSLRIIPPMVAKKTWTNRLPANSIILHKITLIKLCTGIWPAIPPNTIIVNGFAIVIK